MSWAEPQRAHDERQLLKTRDDLYFALTAQETNTVAELWK